VGNQAMTTKPEDKLYRLLYKCNCGCGQLDVVIVSAIRASYIVSQMLESGIKFIQLMDEVTALEVEMEAAESNGLSMKQLQEIIK
jgi:hypothetical protein